MPRRGFRDIGVSFLARRSDVFFEVTELRIQSRKNHTLIDVRSP